MELSIVGCSLEHYVDAFKSKPNTATDFSS